MNNVFVMMPEHLVPFVIELLSKDIVRISRNIELLSESFRSTNAPVTVEIAECYGATVKEYLKDIDQLIRTANQFTDAVARAQAQEVK